MRRAGVQVKLRKGAVVRDPGLTAEAAAASARLTEFEGALLSELRRTGPCTAYQLRSGFQNSPSRSWSGSAGAVYPAVRRLQAQGLISSEPAEGDPRGARSLRLTATGEAAVLDWICDPERASDSGFDPFRTRVTLLDTLPRNRREAFLDALRAAIQARIAWLEAFTEGKDEISRGRVAIDLAQQQARLDWIAARRG